MPLINHDDPAEPESSSAVFIKISPPTLNQSNQFSFCETLNSPLSNSLLIAHSRSRLFVAISHLDFYLSNYACMRRDYHFGKLAAARDNTASGDLRAGRESASACRARSS